MSDRAQGALTSEKLVVIEMMDKAPVLPPMDKVEALPSVEKTWVPGKEAGQEEEPGARPRSDKATGVAHFEKTRSSEVEFEARECSTKTTEQGSQNSSNQGLRPYDYASWGDPS